MDQPVTQEMPETVQAHSSSPGLAADSGLACLLLLARYYGVGTEAASLRHHYGEPERPFDSASLVRAAQGLGFKAGMVAGGPERLAATPLPAIAPHTDGSFVVLAKVDADTVLVHNPLNGRPRSMPRCEFETTWTGSLILLTTRDAGHSHKRQFSFSWFLPQVFRYRRILGEALLASLVLQGIALLTPFFTQIVIDKVLVHKGLTTLHVLALGMLAVILFDAVLGGLRSYLVAHTSSRIDVGLGTYVFTHLLNLPLAYFEARRIGDTAARVRELNTIRQFFTGSALTAIIDGCFTVGVIGLLIWYSPTLSLVVLAALVGYLALSVITAPLLRHRLEDQFTRNAEQHAFLVESVSGIQTIKAHAVEPAWQRRWGDQLAGAVQSGFRARMLGAVTSQLAALLQKATTLVLIWIGAQLVLEGRLTIGQLIAVNMLAGLVTGPMQRLVQMWQDVQQATVSVQRLGDLLNAPVEVVHPKRAALPNLKGHIRFEAVTSRYRVDGPEILKEVSFEVLPGQVVGLVGRSGSGKSTVAKLLQRLYLPEKGRIQIDGTDLAHMDPSWLRRQIGVVPQEPFLFHQTVRDNIALADPGAAMARIMRAAQVAGAHEFISALPDGYDTLVGERGCTLSGGQRQRLAIARALLTNPRILIFDEPTSAQDAEASAQIQELFAHLRQTRTVLIITHQLRTLRHADRILVLDQGAIIESGTHQDLLRRAGVYSNLHRHQEVAHADA